MSAQADIEVSYDVGNEFFSLWLDRQLNYSCALWTDPDDLDDTDLDAAQARKLGYLSELAGTGPDTSVLDIGCGWGANLAYQADVRGVRDMCGITLSGAQLSLARRREIPGATLLLTDYRDFVPERTFDAVLSIGMMEHIASPSDVRSGAHRRIYADFFRRVHTWTRPEGTFALQVILRDRMPRDRADITGLRWVTDHIFPGGMSPRLEDVIAAAGQYWELISLHTRRTHYRRTCQEWLRRFRANREVVENRWGSVVFADYERYLSVCVLAFDRRYQSLGQFGFRRREIR